MPKIEIDDILKERGMRYGNYLRQTMITRDLKNLMRAYCDFEQMLAPDQADSLDQWAVKVARILNGDPNYPDNWRDIQGYAKLVADRLSEEQS